MKLHLAQAGATHIITAYGEGYVSVNQTRHERSLVVMPDRVITGWSASSFDDLSADHLSELADLRCEVLLLGTGKTQRFPRPEILRPLIEARVGIEIMDVKAACRTYNILVAEERKVGAALLLG